jgi:hypothetical protein
MIEPTAWELVRMLLLMMLAAGLLALVADKAGWQ